MAKIPLKIYFNKTTAQVLNSNGTVVQDEQKLPFIRLLEKKVINLQVLNSNTITDKYEEFESGTTADFRLDNDFLNPQLIRTFLNGSGEWLASATANEYYYALAIDEEPATVYENASAMTKGTVGALASGEWAYGDNDSIGESRVYVRLADDTDPDTKAAGWLTYKYSDGDYTPLYVYSDSFNAAGSWYDEGTQSFRDPDITDGEITFELNANTDNFYDRVTADTATGTQQAYSRTKAQIMLFNPGDAEIFDSLMMQFLSYNVFLNDGQVQLDVATLTVYTKAEVDALVGGKIDKPSPAATSGNLAVWDTDGVSLVDGGAVPSGGGDVTGPASSTDEAIARFDGTTGKLLQDGVGTNLDDVGNLAVTSVQALTGVFDEVDVDDDAYGPTWNGALKVPTKNAVYDEMETKAPKDLSGETLKSVVDGSEGVPIDDSGTFKATTVQAIADKVAADLPDVDLEHGIQTPASEIDDDTNGVEIIAIRSKDTAPSTVVVLNHMDGDSGSTDIDDDSSYSHTPAYQGAPTISDAQEVAAGFGTCVLLDGNDGWDYPVTNFDPGADDFAFACKAYIADANKNAYMPLLHIATGGTSDRVLYFYFEGGFLKYKIGTTVGTGDWTDTDSFEVVTSGYMNIDGWNSMVFQRNGDELQAGINGNIVMRLSMASKTLNTPNGASRIRFGYDIDSGSLPDNFFIGYLDEVILIDGDKFLDITTNEATPTTYTDWSDEQYVTKKYDINPNPETPALADDFLREFTASTVNLENVGDTQFYTVPTGKVLFIDKLEVVIVDADTVTVQPEITFGTDSDDDAFVTQQSLDADLNADWKRQVFEVATDGQIAGTDIQFSVKVAATATTQLAKVGLVGYLIDA